MERSSAGIEKSGFLVLGEGGGVRMSLFRIVGGVMALFGLALYPHAADSSYWVRMVLACLFLAGIYLWTRWRD